MVRSWWRAPTRTSNPKSARASGCGPTCGARTCSMPLPRCGSYERLGGLSEMIGFELSQEQKDLRDTVHEFARDVIRPAAPDWDEREETPWPIMQQAHSLGLDTYAYSE